MYLNCTNYAFRFVALTIMNAVRFLQRSPSNFMSLRSFNSSRSNYKALKNWERPSIDEMTIPKDPWKRVFDKNQKKYNAQLMVGVGVFSATATVIVNSVYWNTTPDFLKSVNPVTKLPTAVSSSSDEDDDGDREEAAAAGAEDEAPLVEEESECSSVIDVWLVVLMA